MGSESASELQVKVTLSDCAIGVEFIGCGYSGPLNIIEMKFGARRMAQQNDKRLKVMDAHDKPALKLGLRDAVRARGITETTRSASSFFWFTSVRHALVPVEH
jgi:hypothetical protein